LERKRGERGGGEHFVERGQTERKTGTSKKAEGPSRAQGIIGD
jgi:hypothetical protein